MPGIHPSSRQQVRWAFAAEARGKFPKGKAREWAHDWKCWTEVPVPPGCREAMRILETVRSQHPTWKVPREVLAAEASRHRMPNVVAFPRKKTVVTTRKRALIAAKVAKRKKRRAA